MVTKVVIDVVVSGSDKDYVVTVTENGVDTVTTYETAREAVRAVENATR